MADLPLPSLPGPDQLLSGSAPHSARLLARHYAQAAESALSTIDAGGTISVKARHDLRVALRRLRVTLDAYDAVLRDTLSGKLARRAQTLARRLSATRDRDVRALLIASVVPSRPSMQRGVLEVLDPAGSDDDTLATDVESLRQRWHRIATELRVGLGVWQERHRIDGTRETLPFAMAAADALDRAADRIDRKCAAINAQTDVAALHAARVALKAARYLLAPVAASHHDGDAMVSALRHAQELFGNINDAHGLRARIAESRAIGAESPHPKTALRALVAVEREMEARITASFEELLSWRDAELRHRWVARLYAIAATWRAEATPPREIERKWLLSALPPRVDGLTPWVLRQGYLPGEALVERIRSASRHRVTEWFRTVKIGRGISRIEIEEATTPELGRTLFRLTHGKRVVKQRYAVENGALTWEIDNFTDRALVLAELELPSEDTPVELPAWLAPYVVREVTGERDFTNWQLAR